MKTKADKALEACKEYDRLMSAIKRNTEEIGEGLDVCSRWVDDESGRHFVGGDDTHLAEAFKGYVSEDDWGDPEKCYYTEEQALEIIGDCEGCLKAYNAVQERKANKKKLGAVKRAIRSIGRAA